MKNELSITYRDFESTPALEDAIRSRVEKLEHICDDIVSCHVILEEAHKHKHQGNLFSVHIDLTVPGKELAVTRSPDADHAHEDAYVAIRDAFESMRRQLTEYQQKRRGQVKRHDA